MKLIVNDKIWDIDPSTKGGLLKDMADADFKELNLSTWVNATYFEFYMQPQIWMDLPTKELVNVYKISYYLHAETDMKTIGKEIARRISISTYNGIKQILNFFDISH